MYRGILALVVVATVGATAYSQLRMRSFDRFDSPGRSRQFPDATSNGFYPPTGFLIDRNGTPDWETDPDFQEDLFTFVRVMYNPHGGRFGSWKIDYPDSDLNFSYRLQQLTSLKVAPDPIVLELTDPRIFNYPFLYFVEPGHGLNLTEEEASAFRKYLQNGGFAMFDDFWGEYEWSAFAHEMEKVLPDVHPVDLPLDHPIFNIVYELKEKPMVPAIGHHQQGLRTERFDAQEAHYRGYFDGNGRLMALACHNTDLGDGWEREGEDESYFREYSEKLAYPMGINIIFYVMTH
ncbi:DUF4159 domain-containing protein [Planctomicrobium sp. SH668]|uniref:DUF4159 domain-containing protein n=1 Tax=Planctomicrobium sp. SH668 TaxID=3448126 RepID=UPI003F5C0FA6